MSTIIVIVCGAPDYTNLYFKVTLLATPSGLTTHAQFDGVLRFHNLTKRSEPPAKITGLLPTIQVYSDRTLLCCCAYVMKISITIMLLITDDNICNT